jgi:DNA-binding MarR family transcriptional regulator
MNPDVKFNKVKPKTQLFDSATLLQYIDRSDLVKMAYNELGIEQPQSRQIQMSKELTTDEKYLTEFERLGSTYDENDVLGVVELELENDKPSKSDSQLRNIFLAKALDFNFTDDEANVLSLLNSDEKIMPETIAEALDLDIDEVNKIIDKLRGFKIITGKIGENVDLSEQGKRALKKSGVKLEIEVKYRYAGVRDSKNRPFCAKLLALNKVYSRAEIDAMENENGDSAWIYRGGFYHNPKNDLTTPFCRHHWEAVIMKKNA